MAEHKLCGCNIDSFAVDHNSLVRRRIQVVSRVDYGIYAIVRPDMTSRFALCKLSRYLVEW